MASQAGGNRSKDAQVPDRRQLGSNSVTSAWPVARDQPRADRDVSDSRLTSQNRTSGCLPRIVSICMATRQGNSPSSKPGLGHGLLFVPRHPPLGKDLLDA